MKLSIALGLSTVFLICTMSLRADEREPLDDRLAEDRLGEMASDASLLLRKAIQNAASASEVAVEAATQAAQKLSEVTERERDRRLRRIAANASHGSTVGAQELMEQQLERANIDLDEALKQSDLYVQLKGGNDRDGLCCSRKNCKGCVLIRMDRKTCKSEGFTTFRRHDPSNPYPNEPLPGQCVNL